MESKLQRYTIAFTDGSHTFVVGNWSFEIISGTYIFRSSDDDIEFDMLSARLVNVVRVTRDFVLEQAVDA